MTSAAKLWEQMDRERAPILLIAREASELTVTHLVRDQDTPGSELVQPHNSMGARGVNNLASKLLLALLPPNTAFFRLRPDFEGEPVRPDVRTEVDDWLRRAENTISEEIETTVLRTKVFDALRHGVVAGNSLLYAGEQPRNYGLPSFVVRRGANDELQVLIVREHITEDELPDNLDPRIRDQILASAHNEENRLGQMGGRRKLALYTRVELVREGGGVPYYLETQEVGEIPVEGSEIRYAPHALPWIHLRMNVVAGEDYGRGIVEENIGDLRSLEGLTRSTVEAAAAVAKLLILVDPRAGANLKKRLAGSPNGAIIDGRAEYVGVIQSQKNQDLAFTNEVRREAESRLGASFLLRSTVQRDAERVTAEEVQLVSQELDDALGGIYSMMTVELQLPLVRTLLARLQREKRILIPTENVKPVIVTGLDAIGRGHELARLEQFVGGAIAQFGPAVLEYLQLGTYLSRRAVTVGIDREGLVRSEEEVQQARQQAMVMQLAQSLGPEALKQVGGPGITGALEQALAAAGGGNDAGRFAAAS